MNRTGRALIVALNVVIFWLALPAGLYRLGRQVDGLLPPGRLPRQLGWAGWALAASGAWLCLHAALVLRLRGRGLPISALPPARLVTSGPYRHFRHPIYTGYTLLVAGLGLLAGSPGTTFAVVPAAAALWLATWVKLYEEPVLLARFGATFRAHRDRTPLFFPLGLGRAARRLVLWALRLRVPIRVKGREKLPRAGPFIFVADHLSYLDFLFGQCALRRRVLIPVTAEVCRRPLAAAFVRVVGGVPKRRFCSDPEAARALSDELLCGGVVGIAVEGERSWTGELGALAPGVARALVRFGCPLVPVAFVGSYRLWPRWAGRSDLGAGVTIRVGEPFRLDAEIAGLEPDGGRQAAEVERLVLRRIAALRDPEETSVDLGRLGGIRPELVLWRCPLCRAEERLGMQGRELACAACGARWDASGRDLRLLAPAARAGEQECDTLAGWAARAGAVESLAGRDEPLIAADEVELREEPHARAALGPLHVVGHGRAELRRDRIEWHAVAGERRSLPLGAITSVTTERNDTLQLGLGPAVVQLVFARSSPLRWQCYVLELLKESHNA
ncbi:MAG: 1-acyl-sn-glycerol-3-phosphate acyltransferase [Deltaproteobacteria bacterium]|nr:1-acyl-sn-glycerol-3-phosphate acyltransferase [Deltaproteobacteria bacterium]